MSDSPYMDLSRRERQIMYIVYDRGSATAHEVRDRLPDDPSDSTVRTLLRVLEEKGELYHEEDGPRYVYKPTRSREKVRQSALSHMLKTFFDGSTEQAVAALLDVSSSDLSEQELDRLTDLIEKARREGR